MRRASLAKRSPKVPEIRAGDEVIVLSGKDAGKRGTVERVIVDQAGYAMAKRPGGRPAAWRRISPRSGTTLVVAGINIAKRHTKPRPRRDRGSQMPKIQSGGILDLALPISIGKVMLVCPACGQPTRVKHARPEGGKSIRICGNCEQPVARETKT